MTPNVFYQQTILTKNDRSIKLNQNPCVLWFTGLSGSGKSTIANALELELFKINALTYLLDGDNIRLGLNNDLGFNSADRTENIRRIGEVSKLFIDAGIIVLVASISPFQNDRDKIRNLVGSKEFIEIYVDTPLEVCEKRDSKGLYKRARSGEIDLFTGINSPYEKPLNPDIKINTIENSVEDIVKMILNFLVNNGYLIDRFTKKKK